MRQRHQLPPARPARTTGPPTRKRAPADGRTGALLDIGQAAVLLNTSQRFIRRLVQEQRIPYLKVGRFIRFDPDELDTWLDNCRRPPTGMARIPTLLRNGWPGPQTPQELRC
jgi:excisionase family DNA binding protein